MSGPSFRKISVLAAGSRPARGDAPGLTTIPPVPRGTTAAPRTPSRRCGPGVAPHDADPRPDRRSLDAAGPGRGDIDGGAT